MYHPKPKKFGTYNPKQLSFLTYLLAISFLALLKDTNGKARSYKYQSAPLFVRLGECVTLTATTHFSTTKKPSTSVQVLWKKDTHAISNNNTWLYIGYSKLSDAAFYQVEVRNTASNVIEETYFWLNVKPCNSNEKELPDTKGKCRTSCFQACKAGWRYLKSPFGDRCFKYFSEPKTWLAARDACQTIRAELAVIHNAVENRFIGSLIQSAAGSWIGLNDISSESKFVWNDGTSLGYTSWAVNEPDNYNALCNIENCVIMSRANGKWADTICTAIHQFVCEAPSNNLSGWSCLDSKCYQFFSQYVVRSDAAASCQEKGATLARIKNRQENDFIWRMLKGDIWIGLNDIAEATVFVWDDAAQELSFTNWAEDEPNDIAFFLAPGHRCLGQDCVALNELNSQFSWKDMECDRKKSFVCEQKEGSLAPLGMIVGITIGGMICVAVGAGVIREAIKKRSREKLKTILLNSLERDHYADVVNQLKRRPRTADQLKGRDMQR